jgi:hypothetical protein
MGRNVICHIKGRNWAEGGLKGVLRKTSGRGTERSSRRLEKNAY